VHDVLSTMDALAVAARMDARSRER
jgi:hypothetical protein